MNFNLIQNDRNFDEAMNMHENVLNELGFIDKNIDEIKFHDNSNDHFNEVQNVKDRMSFIPPGENHRFVKDTPYHVGALMSNIYKRVHPLKPSPTVIANGGGGTWGYHYAINRQRLTNRERARIQTFPDWFMFKGKGSEIRTQLGNAVPPFGIKPFAEELLNIFDEFIKFRD
jgi:DNA (cytosine-5)-methyltransferase 1